MNTCSNPLPLCLLMNKEQGLVSQAPHLHWSRLYSTVSSLNWKGGVLSGQEVALGVELLFQGQVSLTMPFLWLLTGVLYVVV